MIRPGILTALALALALILAVIAFASHHKSDGPKPLPAFEEIIPLPRLTSDQQAPEMIFRWRDSSGTLHFSDRAPDDYPSRAIPLDDRVNSLPSVRQ
ncbi:MAG: hypothetical protein R3296_13105 [Oleiphilaceae bacterium]|nr:hypothetical protein [Oleiphilaceae bacterium]